MRIGLIDVDGHNYPNLPLMKLSAYHKKNGDHVEWYHPMFSGHMDKVYMSKVFTFTEDYEYAIDADEIVKGGTGYFYPDGGVQLPHEIEHIYPDYSLYGVTDTAYGFLTRGCPRGCDFCIVGTKEGRVSHKVADLSEFWNGQKYIELLDPNFFSCKEWRSLSEQLIDSNAIINFNQGCDIRIMTEEMVGYIKRMRIKTIHFAWDRYNDKDNVVKRLKMFKEKTGWHRSKIVVYILVGFNTSIEQDLERITICREIGVDPYVMIYEKYNLERGHILKKLQRWVNFRPIWGKCPTFEKYLKGEY